MRGRVAYDVGVARDRNVRMLAPGASVRSVPVRLGSFLLVRGPTVVNRLIRMGEGLHYHGADKAYSFWNHAAFIVGPHQVVQAHPRGVAYAPLDSFTGLPVALVDPKLTAEDAVEAVAFAKACVGEDYGFLTILSALVHAATGGTFSFGLSGTEICSGLVACALERGPFIWSQDPASMSPADLAKAFDVKKPTSW